MLSPLSLLPLPMLLSLPWISARLLILSVLQKLAQFDIPDHTFNWISDYLQDHYQSTVYNNHRICELSLPV